MSSEQTLARLIDALENEEVPCMLVALTCRRELIRDVGAWAARTGAALAGVEKGR